MRDDRDEVELPQRLAEVEERLQYLEAQLEAIHGVTTPRCVDLPGDGPGVPASPK